MSREEDVRRGQQAQTILDNEIFKEAMTALRDDAIAAFKDAVPNDTDALMSARLRLDVTERFLNKFTGLVRNGQYAARKIEDAEKAKLKPSDVFVPRHSQFTM